VVDVDVPDEPLLEPPDPESDELLLLDESEPLVLDESDEVADEPAGVVVDELPRLSFL